MRMREDGEIGVPLESVLGTPLLQAHQPTVDILELHARVTSALRGQEGCRDEESSGGNEAIMLHNYF